MAVVFILKTQWSLIVDNLQQYKVRVKLQNKKKQVEKQRNFKWYVRLLQND